jgi:clan AA aspartic protease (TIGR02281 family)
VRLGPSPGFTQTLAATRKQREGMKSSVIQLITDKGVPQVDVTINGSVNRRMVLDSGASIVTLTAEVANRLGLKPGAEAPTARLVTADGKTTEAKIAKLDSIRLGQFTVEDVACAVLPANVPADECLLGGTFLEHFVYRMDLASGQLFLTQLSGKPKEADALAGKDKSSPPGPATRPSIELLATMKGNVEHKRNGAIVLVTGERIQTAKSYAPPVTFKIVAQTDSTNIRFAYAADHIIFNWEVDRSQFRIDGGPRGRPTRSGRGRSSGEPLGRVRADRPPRRDGHPRRRRRALSHEGRLLQGQAAAGHLHRARRDDHGEVGQRERGPVEPRARSVRRWPRLGFDRCFARRARNALRDALQHAGRHRDRRSATFR